MSQLEADVRAANKLGISYGRYKAISYDPEKAMVPLSPKKRRSRPRKYTDEEAFLLWQEGLSDVKIGAILGVSHQSVQRWRGQLELPVTWRTDIDTKKYRLAAMQDGTTIALHEDDDI